MSAHQIDEERIFHFARDLVSPSARDEYLDQICAGDLALRERVEALLTVHDQEKSFLASSPDAPDAIAETLDQKPCLPRPGHQIGRYKLMEQLGEGGMGTVFVAQQERPIRRKVALKLIKPGMDTKSVVARFEAERQALAMMDHPNIAKVLDAGTTDSGRPYFAMEMVKGVPITDYCDRNRLTIPERLELFNQVCQAIQHAHQKGIIHRDIKPSNVLVTLHDGTPVPKVIDFGVAKALNARLTDKTLYTEHRQIVGTLLYMSPEQAELSGLDIDTRSDIYSLGVLLYELLTGTTPFLQSELKKAGFDEQRRIIRDREPPRASERLSSLGLSATTIAEHRKTDAKQLHHLLSGDLDWIVLKSLEKNRSRRYETASELAADVKRHLGDEPIQARPPSHSYRLLKLMRRHRGAVLAATAIAFTLLIGLAGTSYGLVVAWNTQSKLARTLHDLRIQLVDRSLMYALDGQKLLSSETMKDAVDAGVDPVLQLIAAGEAEIWSGNPEGAVVLHRNAVNSAPESYAAQAALALATSIDPSTHLAETVSLDQLTPRSSYDHLFGARNDVWISPSRALRSLNSADELRETSFYRVIEMNALANASFFDASQGYAAQAVEKARDLHARQKKGSISLTMDLYSRLALLHEQRRAAGDINPVDQQNARLVFDELAEFRDDYFAGRTRAWFLGDHGTPAETMEEWQHRVHLDPQGTDFIQFAACFSRFGESQSAITILDGLAEKQNAYAQLARAQLLAEEDANADEVEQICLSVVEGDGAPLNICAAAIEILILVGRREAAEEVARSRFTSGRIPKTYTGILDYLENGSAMKLLTLAESTEQETNTLFWEFNPVYLMALDEFAKGNYEDALRGFAHCEKLGVFCSSWYWWSKTYKERMQLLLNSSTE